MILVTIVVPREQIPLRETLDEIAMRISSNVRRKVGGEWDATHVTAIAAQESGLYVPGRLVGPTYPLIVFYSGNRLGNEDILGAVEEAIAHVSPEISKRVSREFLGAVNPARLMHGEFPWVEPKTT